MKDVSKCDKEYWESMGVGSDIVITGGILDNGILKEWRIVMDRSPGQSRGGRTEANMVVRAEYEQTQV